MSSNCLESKSLINSPKRELKKGNSYSPRLTSSPFNQSLGESYESDCSLRPYLPECWTDSKRMGSLFCEFRSREANPEGFDLKMNFWTNAIYKWCLQTHSVIFTVDDIRKAFERGSNRPQTKCIQLVMSHLKRNKSVIYFDEYNASHKSNGSKNWVIWGVNALLLKPISIGWSLISTNNRDNNSVEEILSDINVDTKFINTQTLQVMSEELNKFLNQLEDISCIRFDSLFNKCKEKLNINYETLDVLITYLESERKLKVFDDNGIKIIKFGKNVEFKELDIGLIRLETAKELLENETQKLDEEIESIKEEAKVCVRNKNKEKAILLLKKKKRIENKLNKKETQLDNVDLLIDQLLNANSHNLILQAFQKAAEALKMAHNNQEDVESAVSDIEETLDVVNDVISDISRPLVSHDNQDIDHELNELLNELEEKPLNDSKTPDRQQNDEQLAQILQLNNLSLSDDSLSTPEKRTKIASSLETV